MKKALSLFLALTLFLSLSLPALAAAPTETEKEDAAWTLYHMGLFLGTDTDTEGFPVFSLSDAPTRAQGLTMLVRLLGQDEAALEGEWITPFTDVPEWARPYVGYAYDKGLTNGTSETTFSAGKSISATEYLTLVLRALGYDSSTDFAWDSAWTLTDKLGITNRVYSAATISFLRGDVAWVSAKALNAKEKDSDKTLADTLAEQGIKDNNNRCIWTEACVTVQKDKLVFSFTPVKESKEVYTNFEVTSATANGLPCKIEQYTTPAKVKEQCREVSLEEDVNLTLPNAFALVYLRYDENAAKEAAVKQVTAHQGTYPVIELKLHCTGTLKDGTTVTELVRMEYYVDNYIGYY